MYTCIYIYIYIIHNTYTYINTYIHIYIYKHIYTYIHAYIHTYKHTYIHTYIHTNIHSDINFKDHTKLLCCHVYRQVHRRRRAKAAALWCRRCIWTLTWAVQAWRPADSVLFNAMFIEIHWGKLGDKNGDMNRYWRLTYVNMIKKNLWEVQCLLWKITMKHLPKDMLLKAMPKQFLKTYHV